MSNLKNAYQSLANAKEEKEKLTIKKEKLEKIYDILKTYLKDDKSDSTEGKNLQEIIRSLKEDRKYAWMVIACATSIYTIGLGMLDFAVIASSGDWTILPITIIFGLSSYVVATYRSFKEFIESQKNIKQLRAIEKNLNSNPKYKGKTIEGILNLLFKEVEESEELLAEMGIVIKEYEAVLSEVNKELAEEVLVESGIEASVTMSSSMKVLAKRYETESN